MKHWKFKVMENAENLQVYSCEISVSYDKFDTEEKALARAKKEIEKYEIYSKSASIKSCGFEADLNGKTNFLNNEDAILTGYTPKSLPL